MPRLRDMPVVLKREGLWRFIWRIWDQFYKDRLTVWAAALAYSWLFAIFPFIIFLLTLVPYLPIDRVKLIDRIESTLRASLPRDAAVTLTANVAQVLNERHDKVMSIGIALAIWAASGGMAATMSALNRCYEVDEDPPWYKQRPIAIALTLVVIILILIVLVLLPLGSAVTRWIIDHGGVIHIKDREIRLSAAFLALWQVFRYGLGLLLLLSIVTLVYHFGIAARVRFRFLTPGGLFTVACWLLMGLAVRIYVERFAQYNKTYGAVGGAVVLLLVFYLDSLVLLIGAEINAEVDFAMTAVSTDRKPEETPDLKPSPPAATTPPKPAL